MDSRATAASPALACAATAGLASALVLLGLAPMRGSAASTLLVLGASLLVPGFLLAVALRLHGTWHSIASALASALALGAGVALPVAWTLRAIGWPLEAGAGVLVAFDVASFAAIFALARRGRLGDFDGLRSRSAAEWGADAFLGLAALVVAATFAIGIEPAMPGGDLWYYLSYIDWMAERPGLEYVPHSLDPEEWNPRLQSSGFLAFEAMLARLVRVDANALQVFWSWLPLGLIPLALVACYALAVSLGSGALTRTALVVAQLALLYATLPYVFDRATSGARWPATVIFFRASQDKVFLATLLAPAVAMFGAEWLARGQRRFLAALLVTGAACVMTHPLGLPFFAMVTLPFAFVGVVTRTASWQRAGALLLLLLPLLAWPLSQRADEGAPTSLADDAGFARREHLTRDSLRITSREENRFTAHPSLVAHPLLIAGIASGLALLGLARERADARYAFATTAAPLLMLYTPGIAPLAGLVVTPYLLWRFTWLLPIALALALGAVAAATLARRALPSSGRWGAAAFTLVVVFATGMPGDLARVDDAFAALGPAENSAAQATAWIEPLSARVGNETVLIDPTLQPLALALGPGLQTGYWRPGSDPRLYARVVDFYGSQLFAPRHEGLLRELDVRWVATSSNAPIAGALEARGERFERTSTLGSVQLFRAIETSSEVLEPIAHWRARSAAEPGSPTARGRLTLALLEAGNRTEARQLLEASVARGDADAAAFEQLGTLSLGDRDYEGARFHLERSIELDPSRPTARNNLAWLLATCPVATLRDGAAARRHASKLLAGGHRDAGSLDTAAAAFAAAGDFDAAVRYATQALVIYESGGTRESTLMPVRARLEGYRAHRAFIDVAD